MKREAGQPYMKYEPSQKMKAPNVGSGVMGNAGNPQKIMPCEFPDMKRIDPMPSSNRGYDQEAWNYKY